MKTFLDDISLHPAEERHEIRAGERGFEAVADSAGLQNEQGLLPAPAHDIDEVEGGGQSRLPAPAAALAA